MCDIRNPLFGKNGAAYIFGPQKGADSDTVILLDKGLTYFAHVVKQQLGIDVSAFPGAGAAGGMAAFLSSKIQMGIDTILDIVNLEKLACDSDMIFTGEGKIDTQSLEGKVVIGVAKRAQRLNVPLIAIVGDIGDDISSVYDLGVSAIFSINRAAVDFNIAKLRCKKDLELTMDNLMRFFLKLSV